MSFVRVTARSIDISRNEREVVPSKFIGDIFFSRHSSQVPFTAVCSAELPSRDARLPLTFFFLVISGTEGNIGETIRSSIYKFSPMEKNLARAEKWLCAGAGHNSDRSTIRYSALDSVKETSLDADERFCDLGRTVSWLSIQMFRSHRRICSMYSTTVRLYQYGI